MLSFLRDLIGPSATNWLIIAAAALVFFAAATLLPALMRHVGRKGREPLL
jgi:Sec-independent protein translocase protein TatA